MPDKKPSNSNFSSGPTAKRPGWSILNLKGSLVSRSHRSPECKKKLKEVIDKSKAILKLPKDYKLCIMPGSNTGALEASLWSILGARGVDILSWENFGKDWVVDVVDQLKIQDPNIHDVDYGFLPDFSKVNFNNDVIFTWNGTTSGVKVPDGDWIPENRKGLTICDATSAIFAMPIDYEKCDVLTWSWQKVLGGEAAHGMLALSPRALERLETYQPSWPIPKAFRLANNKKIISGIFEGNTINTPSMICVEDSIDSLNWIERIGGLDELISRSNRSFYFVSEWILKTPWVDFMCAIPSARSNTSITFQIIEDWFINMENTSKKEVMQKITTKLKEKNIANDINGYPKAPLSFRVWAGGTVDPEDIKILLPWIEWAYSEIKSQYD